MRPGTLEAQDPLICQLGPLGPLMLVFSFGLPDALHSCSFRCRIRIHHSYSTYKGGFLSVSFKAAGSNLAPSIVALDYCFSTASIGSFVPNLPLLHQVGLLVTPNLITRYTGVDRIVILLLTTRSFHIFLHNHNSRWIADHSQPSTWCCLKQGTQHLTTTPTPTKLRVWLTQFRPLLLFRARRGSNSCQSRQSTPLQYRRQNSQCSWLGSTRQLRVAGPANLILYSQSRITYACRTTTGLRRCSPAGMVTCRLPRMRPMTPTPRLARRPLEELLMMLRLHDCKTSIRLEDCAKL